MPLKGIWVFFYPCLLYYGKLWKRLINIVYHCCIEVTNLQNYKSKHSGSYQVLGLKLILFLPVSVMAKGVSTILFWLSSYYLWNKSYKLWWSLKNWWILWIYNLFILLVLIILQCTCTVWNDDWHEKSAAMTCTY